MDWAKRDEELQARICSAVNELRSYNDSRKVLRRALFLACPTLASALEKRDRYPSRGRFYSR